MRNIVASLISAACLIIILSGKPAGPDKSHTLIQQADQSEGSQLYNKYCLTCHQVNGKGIRNMFPPLAGNEKITGHPDELIKIVLFGLEGPITVNGREYNQPMPPQAYLTDKQISLILSYIRSSWGNNAPTITSENVEKIRKQGK